MSGAAMAGAEGGKGRAAAAGLGPRVVPLATRLRRWHGALAPFVLLPLLLTVASGLGYRLLRDWGGLERDRVHLLMTLHEGEWLKTWFGPPGETLYVLLNGLGLLWMIGSGAAMLWQRWRPMRAKGAGAQDG